MSDGIFLRVFAKAVHENGVLERTKTLSPEK